MQLTRIQLRDFRNYERAEVELAPGLNVVAGANGAGKTNLLEAIYFGLTARSCRTSNEREMLRLGAKVARVELEVSAEDGMHRLEVGLEPGEDKRIRVDGAPLARGVDPPRPLVSVFLPDRLDLVKGGDPPARRTHALSRSGTRSSVACGPASRPWTSSTSGTPSSPDTAPS